MNTDQLLQAESLVAVLGIKHVLRSEPAPPSDVELRRAEKMPATIKRRVRELLDAKQATKEVGPPDLPDYWKTSEALAKGVDGDGLADMLATLPLEQQAPAVMVWTKAIAYLNAIFPRRIEQRLTGPYAHEASHGEFAEWAWAWRIANAPMFAIDLAREGMLIGAEVGHLKQVFPSLYAEICGEIMNALSDKIAESKDWQPPWWLRKQLCTLLGISPVSDTLLKDIEQAVQQSQAESKLRTSALKAPSDASTQSEKLAGGSGQ